MGIYLYACNHKGCMIVISLLLPVFNLNPYFWLALPSYLQAFFVWKTNKKLEL